MKCKICENTSNFKIYEVKEMMFGFKDKFIYNNCLDCNSLQIDQIPLNIEKYYPKNYYSYSLGGFNKKKYNLFNFLKLKRNKYAATNNDFLGRLLYNFLPHEALRSLSYIPTTKSSKILDVGCGNGRLLFDLKKIGFKNLVGVDPFIENDFKIENDIVIKKCSIHEIQEKQDVIMFHHSFEHLPDPLKTIHSVSNILNKKGYVIIRVPTLSYAWEYYKENWVQLDAPRHFFIHSEKSINHLIENTDLKLEKIIYDSTDFQFWGSEQYRKGIPLRSEISYSENPKKSIFTKKELKEFRNKAKQLNQENNGDTCVFILKKQ